jgi:hypothetical protein
LKFSPVIYSVKNIFNTTLGFKILFYLNNQHVLIIDL